LWCRTPSPVPYLSLQAQAAAVQIPIRASLPTQTRRMVAMVSALMMLVQAELAVLAARKEPTQGMVRTLAGGEVIVVLVVLEHKGVLEGMRSSQEGLAVHQAIDMNPDMDLALGDSGVVERAMVSVLEAQAAIRAAEEGVITTVEAEAAR